MWMPILWSFLIGLVIFLTYVYWLVRADVSFCLKNGIPYKKPHWLMGNMARVIKAEVSFVEDLSENYKEFKVRRFYGAWRFTTLRIIFTDLELLKRIMVSDFGAWTDRHLYLNPKADPLSMNLGYLGGKAWRTTRTKLSPIFTSGKLKLMYPLLVECEEKFQKWLHKIVKPEEPVEARDLMSRLTIEVICLCALGVRINSLNNDDSIFRVMAGKIFQTSIRKTVLQTVFFICPSLLYFFNFCSNEKDVTEFLLKFTREAIDYRRKNNSEANDFFDLLMKLKDEIQLDEDSVDPMNFGLFREEFTDELLAAQVFIFFVAGFETTAAAISFCMYELAANKHIQGRVREEVRRQKNLDNGELTHGGLKNLTYLDMVLQETTRKYPPIPAVNRKSTKPWRIPDTNIVLPTGTICTIPIYAVHHDPEYFPEPEKFDPLRFTEEAKQHRPLPSFLAFGAGPRNCIGERFYDLQAKLSIAMLVDNYDISVSEKTQHPLELDTRAELLTAKGGIWLHMEKRSGISNTERSCNVEI